jgi:hypothetical protein
MHTIARICGVCIGTVKVVPLRNFNGRTRIEQVIFLGLAWCPPGGRLAAFRDELEDYFMLGALPDADTLAHRRAITAMHGSEGVRLALIPKEGDIPPKNPKPTLDLANSFEII